MDLVGGVRHATAMMSQYDLLVAFVFRYHFTIMINEIVYLHVFFSVIEKKSPQYKTVYIALTYCHTSDRMGYYSMF